MEDSDVEVVDDPQVKNGDDVPSILKYNFNVVSKLENGNVTAKCKFCTASIKGNLRSTGFFHLHIKVISFFDVFFFPNYYDFLFFFVYCTKRTVKHGVTQKKWVQKLKSFNIMHLVYLNMLFLNRFLS